MIMKQYQLANAYRATDWLAGNEHLTVQTRWDVYDLRNRLRPYYEFQLNEENLMRKKYIPFVQEDGSLVGEAHDKFLNDMAELNNLEIDIGEIHPFEIQMRDDDGIRVRDMEALENFIHFQRDPCLQK